MSVINQMLKDLDKRQQTNAQNMSPLVEESGRSVRAYVLMAIALLALLISAWLALRYFQNLDDVSDVQVLSEAPVRSSEQGPNLSEQLQAVAVAIDVDLAETDTSLSDVAPQKAASSASTMPEIETETEAVVVQSKAPEQSTAGKQVSLDTSSTAKALEPRPSSQASAKPAIEPPPIKPSAVVAAQTLPDEPKPVVEEPVVEESKQQSSTVDTSVSLEIKPLKLSREQQVALYTKRGFQALDRHSPTDARAEFSKALQLDHYAHEVREQLAALQFGRGDVSAAVNLLEEGVQLNRSRGSFRLMLARIFVQQDNLPQAVFYLESAQPDVAGNIDYYAMLAGLAQRLDKQELALSAYQTLVKHEPSRARWWLGYAIANDKLTQYQEALAAYRQAEVLGQLSSHSRDFVAARIRQLEQ
ncbi:tetratricopeptide repeat protein [Agarivorans sp. MS3-6]|uniref:tetratricopeptide repeat protein n=1 Tax=Agarivorans sp. TSD2052 TaxID=2937286 RepID=UPI00200EAFBE|nr:tetratricopeptide repeat protein [Agarivorans sp. TSD2052]UPW18004.1 hypothetical protein M0C34_17480 [Agarivorans sp. TSD2052]